MVAFTWFYAAGIFSIIEVGRCATTSPLEQRMKFVLISALLLAGALMMEGCSASSVDEKTAAKGNTNLSSPAGNTNTAALTNGMETQPPQTANANTAAPSSDPLQRPGNALSDKLERLRKNGASGPPVDASELARQNARPAPDDSTFTSYLTDAGYEIRTFKNHPQLVKVEKKIAGDGTQSLKVFLRNGKVVNLPPQSISPLATAPASLILQAAGVTAPPPAPSGPVPGKKSGE